MSLAVRDLSKTFENLQVLQGVNLDFKDSGIYCLMGPSGTGKTTFENLQVLQGVNLDFKGKQFTGSKISKIKFKTVKFRTNDIKLCLL